MDKKSKKKDEGQGARAQMLLPVLGLLVTLKGDLLELVVRSGLQVLGALLEQERTLLCGPRYRHQPERRTERAGYAKGELPLGGRRVSIARPRVRSVDGAEVPLPSWEEFSKTDPLTERAVEQMLIGVATRKYDRSLEPLPDGVNSRGTSRSAVSRRFVNATAEKLSAEWSGSLAELRLSAMMIDGIVCGEHTVLVVIGIDEKGNKHVLGLAEGATENASACTRLLANLVERGLDTTRSLLVVIDGAKALAKAVRSVFGARALIQRCQVHKKRNVLESLPEQMKSSIGAMMTTAYQCRDPKKAILMLKKIARQLDNHHPGAAESLREGLEETVTITAADLCEPLRRTLATTNPIENINGAIRRTTRNVKRWQGGTMVLRWVGAALHEAAKGFHRLKGHAGMPKLVAFLRANDVRLDGAVAARPKAA